MPAGVLVLGVGVSFAVASYERGGDEPETPTPPPRVEVVRVEPVQRRSVVYGSGQVQAARRLPLSAEVGGRVVEVADALEPGGRVREGELLLRIDPRDYRAELASRQSSVAEAKLALRRAQADREVAAESHGRADIGRQPPSALALKLPQVKTQRARLQAAQAAARRARADLRRTRVRAPWDAAVVSVAVEEGQQITPGQKVAELVGTERFWVRVAVPVSELEWITPREQSDGEGAPVRITQRSEEGEELEHYGRLVRRIPQLERGTQRALLLVEVERPMQGPAPLLPGAKVDAHIEGEVMQGVIVVPAEALHGGRFVWRVDDDERLSRVEVEVAFTSADQPGERVLAPGALQAGDRIVTTRLPEALEGARVRIAEAEKGGS